MSKIKSKKTYASYLNDEGEQVGKQIVKLEEYSDSGQVLLTVSYENEEEIERIENSYENNFIVGAKIINPLDGLENKLEYGYANGKLSYSREYFNDKDYIESKYQYYPDGKTQSITSIDNDDEFHGKTVWEYNDAENSFTEMEFGEGDFKKKEEIVVKDEKGNEVENRTTTFEPDGWKTTRIVKKTFNEKGDVLDAEVYDDGKLVFTMTNHYYEDSGLLEEKDMVDKMSGAESEIVYTYDDKNREIKRETYNNDALTGIREFSYDDYGNVVQEKVSVLSAMDYYDVDIFEFEMEYFEQL